MNLEKIIHKIETETNLPDIKYMNFHVWLAIRKHIYPKLTKGIYKLKSPQGIKVVKLFLNAFYGFSYWFHRYDYWFISSTTTRKPINGTYRDIFTDHIMEKLPNSWKIEYTLKQHYPKKLIPYQKVSSMLLLIIVEKFISCLLTNNKKIIEIENEILKHFKTIKRNEIDIKHSIKKIVGQYHTMKLLLFFKKKPKVLFLVSAYSYYGYVKALKEKSVKIVEIQHGVINNSHVGYVIYSNYPNLYFPDYLLSFGSNEKKILKHPNRFSEVTKIHPTGSYIIDYYKNNFKPQKELSELIKKYELSFCVSLQDCEVGFSIIPWIIEIAKNNPKNIFVLKPRETPISYYKENYNFPTNTIFNNNLNIYELILHCDYHITAYSTTALEAPSLGKPNILFNIENKAMTYYKIILTQNKSTFYLNSTAEFDKIISKLQNMSSKEVIEANANIFKPNYLKNLYNFLSHNL